MVCIERTVATVHSGVWFTAKLSSNGHYWKPLVVTVVDSIGVAVIVAMVALLSLGNRVSPVDR